MQVGDLVKFKTGYTGIILECTEDLGVTIFVNESDIPFKNPTYMTMGFLQRTAEVISSAEANSQSKAR